MTNNLDEFFKLPIEVQRGFVSQFRQVIDTAIFCGTHFEVFGMSMTREQFNTFSEIVRRYDNGKKC